MKTLGRDAGMVAKDLLAHLATGSGLRRKGFREFESWKVVSKKAYARPEGAHQTVRSFQRIGPPHGMCFARN